MDQKQSDLYAGAALRAARQSLGREITDIAKELCISRRYLEAMEAEALDDLPSETYALGFLRSYAALLGLDPQPQVDAFRKLMAPPDEAINLTPVAVDSPSRNPARWVMALAVAGSLAVYLGWTQFGQQAVPAPDATVISDDGAISADEANIRTDAVSPEPVADDEVVESSASAPAKDSSDPVQKVATAAIELNAPPPLQAKFRLVARRDTWLLLANQEGNLIFEGVLLAGGEQPLDIDKDFLLTTGDAGALDLYFGTRLVAAVGRSGQVIRDKPIQYADADPGGSSE